MGGAGALRIAEKLALGLFSALFSAELFSPAVSGRAAPGAPPGSAGNSSLLGTRCTVLRLGAGAVPRRAPLPRVLLVPAVRALRGFDFFAPAAPAVGESGESVEARSVDAFCARRGALPLVFPSSFGSVRASVPSGRMWGKRQSLP